MNRQEALSIIKHKAKEFASLPEIYRLDRGFVMAAVKANWRVLKYADERFKTDSRIAIQAIIKNKRAFAYLSDMLKYDRDFFIKAMREGVQLSQAPKELTFDRKIVLEATKYISWNLVGFKNFLSDRKIVLAAISHSDGHPDVLRQASDKLRDDREIVLEAVQYDPEALRYASVRLRKDPTILQAVGVIN